MLMGVLAASLLDYEEVFRRPNMACWMRPVSDPVVMFGPLLQPLRRVVFALVLFPVREVIFGRRRPNATIVAAPAVITNDPTIRVRICPS